MTADEESMFVALMADVDTVVRLNWLFPQEPELVAHLLSAWVHAEQWKQVPTGAPVVDAADEPWHAARQVLADWDPDLGLPLEMVDSWIRAINGLRMNLHHRGEEEAVLWLGSVLERTLAEL